MFNSDNLVYPYPGQEGPPWHPHALSRARERFPNLTGVESQTLLAYILTKVLLAGEIVLTESQWVVDGKGRQAVAKKRDAARTTILGHCWGGEAIEFIVDPVDGVVVTVVNPMARDA